MERKLFSELRKECSCSSHKMKAFNELVRSFAISNVQIKSEGESKGQPYFTTEITIPSKRGEVSIGIFDGQDYNETFHTDKLTPGKAYFSYTGGYEFGGVKRTLPTELDATKLSRVITEALMTEVVFKTYNNSLAEQIRKEFKL